jgi:hypothetical protein
MRTTRDMLESSLQANTDCRTRTTQRWQSKRLEHLFKELIVKQFVKLFSSHVNISSSYHSTSLLDQSRSGEIGKGEEHARCGRTS